MGAAERRITMINCDNCLHDGVCYMQEICGSDIDEQLREFGCKDFKHRTYWVEKRYGTWRWTGHHWECSACRNPRFHDLVLGLDAAYCGHCGAFMEGSE